MAISIAGPLSSIEELDGLAPLWRDLHLHHLQVASYRPLVEDLDESWMRRRAWYKRLLGEGGAFLVAHDLGQRVAYAFLQVVPGLDDTFEVKNGIVEIVSLMVAPGARGRGVGAALLRAAEAVARVHDIDTLKVAVMAGNDRALAFYRAGEFATGEEVLYRRLTN